MSLIIDQPLLIPLSRRIGWGSVTIAFWGIWVYLWLPFVTLAAWALGFHQASAQFTWTQDAAELQRLFILYIVIVAWLGGALLLWARIEYLRFRNVNRRAVPSAATLDELAVYASLDADDMRAWQDERCLVASHDENGNMVEANIKR